MTEYYVPYNEIPPAFSIGLKPVNPNNFIQIDDDLNKYLRIKKKLYKKQFGDVFMEEPNTKNAQEEAVGLIKKSIDQEIPETRLAPLAEAALHIQDDLVIMRRDESGWRLVVGAVCFPSSWNLKEKFGKPLEVIHKPVPYMEPKMSERIRRIFDAMKPQTPMWRQNWSLDVDDNLRHDKKESDKHDGHKKNMFESDNVWLRCEYQTLHKLPVSNDILFTIKILNKSVAEVANSQNGKEILKKLRERCEEIGSEGRMYKGIRIDQFREWIRKYE